MTSGNLSLETRGGRVTALIGMDVLFGKVGCTVSDGCKGQVSSSEELELASMKEASEELTFERDDADDLELDSEPEGRAPKGVRTRTGRRVVAGIRVNSADVGLWPGFSAVPPGPGNRDSWAACGSGSE